MTTESLVSGQDTPNAGGQQSADGVKPDSAGAQPNGGNAPEANADGQQAGANADGAQPKGDEKPADDKGAKAPESYDFKMPEGVALDSAAAEEFSGIAKEYGLTQEQAQKVADVGAKMVQRQLEAHAAQVAEWTEAVKTDKEIGGDKLNENLAIARKTIDTFGSPELKNVLNQTGLGNHPEIVKLAYKIGKAISDDGFVRGGNTTAPRSAAEIMYPSMAKN
jgi:hypothetical protein